MSSPPHSKSPEEVLKDLGATEGGLTDEEATQRLTAHGPNELEEARRTSPWRLFLSQFQDLMVVVLIGAALLSAGLAFLEDSQEEWLDAAVIMTIVVLNAIFGFVQEYKAEKVIQALRDLSAPRANVIRGGVERNIASRELVPGDVLVLVAGDKVSADGRLLQAINLKINEASLTGESMPVEKKVAPVSAEAPVADRNDMVFSGCLVEYGKGRAVVTSTGMSTELGRIASLISNVEETTPLQKKLAALGRQLAFVVLGACGLVFAIGVLRGLELSEVFLTSVSLAVAAIPEGLPAIVTVSLALGLQRLAKRNAFIRRLPAVESLGAATVICTDKTGTLTKGEMNVREVLTSDRYHVTGEGYSPDGSFLLGEVTIRPDAHKDLVDLLQGAALCNDSQLYQDEGRWRVKGDPTEGALVVAAAKSGMDLGELYSRGPRVFEVPFDSVSKRMITVHQKGDTAVAYLKGAGESVLALCDKRMEMDRTVPLDRDGVEQALEQNDEMARRALRVLAVASKDLPDSGSGDAGLQGGFTFLGLVGMIDAPRKEAMEALQRCKKAGIRVIMITGDHELTAKTIASEMCIGECGTARAMNGRTLENTSMEDLQVQVNQLDVFARVAPEQKVKIVEALQRNGEVVAMTGDGVNDAPALKKADIGLAMGITGTDVAKESSDIVLGDDNFATIVNAVEEGRGIYDNIRHFVRFLLTCNSGEVGAMVLASLLFSDPALLPLLLPAQLLLMNLVTDGLPAIALGLERTDPSVMERPPRDPKASPIDRAMGWRILIIGTAIAISSLLTFAVVYWGLEGGDGTPDRARTAALCAMVLSQMLFVFSARSESKTLWSMGPLSNRKLVLAVVVSFSIQLAIVYVPFLSDAFRTVPLGGEDWAVIVPLSALAFLMNETGKWWGKR